MDYIGESAIGSNGIYSGNLEACEGHCEMPVRVLLYSSPLSRLTIQLATSSSFRTTLHTVEIWIS